MSQIYLTDALKNHHAIIILEGQDIPKDYVAIAGALIAGRDVEIAIPKNVMERVDLFNSLARQALDCLTKSMVKLI